MVLDIGVHGRNERVVSVLKNLDSEAVCEALGSGVEVAKYVVTSLPSHKVGGVWVYPCHEKRHCPY